MVFYYTEQFNKLRINSLPLNEHDYGLINQQYTESSLRALERIKQKL